MFLAFKNICFVFEPSYDTLILCFYILPIIIFFYSGEVDALKHKLPAILTEICPSNTFSSQSIAFKSVTKCVNW